MTVKEFARKHRLRVHKDEDYTDIIPGKVGHIYEYDDDLLGAMVMPSPPRKQYWGFTRAALVAADCMVVQNGDGEGAVTFDPHNLEQVKAALKACRIKRIQQRSAKQVEVSRRALEVAHRQRGATAKGRRNAAAKGL